MQNCKPISWGTHMYYQYSINPPAYARRPLSCCNPCGCGSVLFMVRLVSHTLKHLNHTLYTGDCFDECFLMSGGRLHLTDSCYTVLCLYVQWD